MPHITAVSRGATRSKFRRGQISGEARTEGAKRPRIEGEARTEGEARDRAGGGVWGGGSVSPSPENFWKFKLETLQSGAQFNQQSIF